MGRAKEAPPEPVSGGETIEDDGAPAGPTAEEESAFLSEQGAMADSLPVPAGLPEPAAADRLEPLPGLDELVQRIPAETRELLDDLFRAKFVTVRRVRKQDLKAGARPGADAPGVPSFPPH